MNLDLWVVYFIVQDIAENLTKGQFAQNLKNLMSGGREEGG